MGAWYGARRPWACRRRAPPRRLVDAANTSLVEHLRCRRAVLALIVVTAAWAVPTAARAAGIGAQQEAVRRLEVDVAGLDAQYGQAAASYDRAQATLQSTREHIRENAAALRQARRDHRSAQRLLARRVSAIYRQPPLTGVEILLSSSSLSEAMAKVDLFRRVENQDGQVVASIAAARTRMREARRHLLADQVVERQEARDARDRLAEVRVVVASRRAVLVSARSRLAAMIAVEARRQAAAARLVALRAARARVSVAVTRPPSLVAAPAPGTLVSGLPVGGRTSPGSALAAIAACESGGNPSAVSPSGLFRGKYQFDPATWQRLGGQGADPAAAPEAEQDRVAGILYGRQGAAPWPVCGR
jgi:peptidoglycan hydrolase CwlO-like protein